MKKLVLLLVFFALIVGCTKREKKNYIIEVIDGVKVFKNMNIPSDENLEIKPGEIFVIEGLDKNNEGSARELAWPRFLDIDSKGNIYIVDTASASVKKFDKNGEFITSFGRQGNGPGEMIRPFMIALIDDIVLVAGNSAQRISRFDTAGNFIDEFIIKTALPRYLQPVGKDKFVCFKRSYQQTDKGLYQGFNLAVTDTQFRDIAVLLEYKRKFNPAVNDFLEMFTPYAVGKDRIFVAENSESLYKINVFDFSGTLLYSIEKEYDKVLFDQSELDELNQTLEKIIKRFGNPDYQPIKTRYKKAINSMYCDEEGRLLVASSVERNQGNRYDFLVDVFKDGVFLKKIKLGIAKGYDFLKIHDEKIFFKGGRIYHLDESTAVIKVFEY